MVKERRKEKRKQRHSIDNANYENVKVLLGFYTCFTAGPYIRQVSVVCHLFGPSQLLSSPYIYSLPKFSVFQSAERGIQKKKGYILFHLHFFAHGKSTRRQQKRRKKKKSIHTYTQRQNKTSRHRDSGGKKKCSINQSVVRHLYRKKTKAQEIDETN